MLRIGSLLGSAVALHACASDGRELPTFPKDVPLYAVFTQVETADGESAYLGVTDTLDGEVELDLSRSLEVPGASRFYAPSSGGFFALGSNEDYSITRYDLDEQGRPRESGRVSFAAIGVSRLHFRAVFVSETKAYYIDHTQAQIVVWNPRTMEIERSIQLPEELQNGYEGYTTVLPYHRYPLVQDRLFIPVSWYNFEQGTARDVTGLVVFDTDKDEVISYTETDRCAGASELAFDANGDVYYGTSVNHPFYAFAQDPQQRAVERPGCILRIRAGEQEFDPDYLVKLSDVVQGGVAMGLTDGAEPGIGYVQVLDEDEQRWSDVTSEDEFWESAAWRWWRLDLAKGTA
ncbi:MAG TPA: hypothetical protein VFZ61_30735, partial [Polyangiales bacterium]